MLCVDNKKDKTEALKAMCDWHSIWFFCKKKRQGVISAF